MEDYIFLIIAVVLSLFAAIKKNKKKTDEENPFVEQAERPGNFFMDQFLGKDFMDEPEEEVKPAVRIKPVANKEAVVRTISDNHTVFHPAQFRSTLPERTKRNLQPTVKKPMVEETEDDLETDEFPGYLEDFSLRKAFVYSEIMGQKYNMETKFN